MKFDVENEVPIRGSNGFCFFVCEVKNSLSLAGQPAETFGG